MFGTIGHARPKPGHGAQFDALNAEWEQTIRPMIPRGHVRVGAVPSRKTSRTGPGQPSAHTIPVSGSMFRNTMSGGASGSFFE